MPSTSCGSTNPSHNPSGSSPCHVNELKRQYATHYAVYNALLVYREMLLSIPGGPQAIPNFELLLSSIDNQIATSYTGAQEINALSRCP